jgi:isocitrate dehydrogenase
MVIFRENTEDIYAGIEFEEGSRRGRSSAALLKENFPDASARSASPTAPASA